MRIDNILDEMGSHGLYVPDDKIYINIDNADSIFRDTFKYFLELHGGEMEMQFLPEYRDIIEWLSDNKGKGLFLYGNVGRGKTVIARYVIPAILLNYANKSVCYYDAQEMNEKLDEVLKKGIICIDDVGIEDIAVTYGNRRLAFLEVLDRVEKRSKLLIATSNLASPEQIINKYGDRGMDRIIATMKRVPFKGKSLRK
ncbi:MAG: ATP-binding protein [Tissierellia bacterium]|nr:ATP-binding protein [Tissierellia bacterium]